MEEIRRISCNTNCLGWSVCSGGCYRISTEQHAGEEFRKRLLRRPCIKTGVVLFRALQPRFIHECHTYCHCGVTTSMRVIQAARFLDRTNGNRATVSPADSSETTLGNPAKYCLEARKPL